MSARDVVITGVGVVSPIGIGTEAHWTSLISGTSGVRRVTLFDTGGTSLPFGGEITDFDPKEFVKPRKSLKVMSRDIQFGVTAADMACAQAGLRGGAVDPERFGVVFAADMMHCALDEIESAYRSSTVEGRFDFARWGEQAMSQIYPLWMLKYLPNMPACHVAIAQDARGPNNSHSLGEASSLMAFAEAARVIQRGSADVMITGGASSRLHPICWMRGQIASTARRTDHPETASRPFDKDREGLVMSEGAAALIFESRQHAEARGATILGRIVGCGGGFSPRRKGAVSRGAGIRASIQAALRAAGLSPQDIGHVNANGLSTIEDDALEAQAIRDVLGNVPVTAPKSFYGTCGAGTGAVESIASVLGLLHGLVPYTLNYDTPDPTCPVNVVHGEPMPVEIPTALLLNQSLTGQAAAVVIARE